MTDVFYKWKKKALNELKRRFMLDSCDFFSDEVLRDCHKDGDTPEEVVDWFGQKYCLNECDE